MASNLSTQVKQRLTGDEARAFHAACDAPARAIGDWRAGLRLGGADLRQHVGSLLPSEKERVTRAMRRYLDGCLAQLASLRSEPLRDFVAARVGVLRLRDSVVFCTATLVTPQLLLTAYHCLDDILQSGSRFQNVVFSRVGASAVAVALTGRTQRSAHYNTPGRRVFEEQEYDSDFVLLELETALPMLGPSAWPALRLQRPPPHEALTLVSYNLYAEMVARSEGRRDGWLAHMRADTSPTCLAASLIRKRVIQHGCQTEGASSGAPLLSVDATTGAVTIWAVHTGAVPRGGALPGATIAPALVPNYGVIVEDATILAEIRQGIASAGPGR